MERSAKEIRDVNDALAGVPMADRLMALVASVTTANPGGMEGVAALIAVCGLMARALNQNERERLAEHMRLESYRIDGAQIVN